MVFLVGNLTQEWFASSEVKHISHIKEIEELQDGDVVELLDYAMVYDSAASVTEDICKRFVVPQFSAISTLTR